jgi:hypothetical protein
MLYLVTREWVEDPTVNAEEFPSLWEQMVRPSLEILAKTFDDKKTGGVFAGQRMGAFILDMSSNEEVGSFLATLPFWNRLTWNVTPLQSFRSGTNKDKDSQHIKQLNCTHGS